MQGAQQEFTTHQQQGNEEPYASFLIIAYFYDAIIALFPGMTSILRLPIS